MNSFDLDRFQRVVDRNDKRFEESEWLHKEVKV